MTPRRRRRATAIVLAIAGAGLLLGGCGGEEDSTENGQAAVRNALTAETSNTQDRPGGPADTGGNGATTAPGSTGSSVTEPPPEEGSPTATAERTPGEGGDTAEVAIPADPTDLAFTKTRVTAPAGSIRLTMANPSDIPHNIAVDRPEKVQGKVVGKGGKSEITLTFPPGTYEYYCSVPGHRQAGMVGTLTVTG